MIKLTPAIFVLLFLVRGNLRAIFAFGLALVSFAALGTLVVPWEYSIAFVETLSQLGDRILLSRINHSLESLIYLAWAWATGLGQAGFAGFEWIVAPVWVSPLSRLIMLAGVGVGLWACQKLESHRVWAQTLIIALWPSFGGPMGWTHYLLLPLLLLPGLMAVLPIGKALVIILVLAAPFSVPVFSVLTALDMPELLPTLWGMGWQIIAIIGLSMLVLNSKNRH